MGARDVLAVIRSPKLENINEFGLTTKHYNHASVVMLSNHTSNSSIRQFMKYIYSAHDVYSTLLKCIPLRSASEFASGCNCESTSVTAERGSHECNCIVFYTVKDITIMLARRMPKTLKQLSDTQCLLPSLHCQKNGCHGCNQGVLDVEDTGNGKEPRLTLTETDPKVEFTCAAVEALDFKFTTDIQEKPICICIPLHSVSVSDDWTKLLVRSFKSKDKEDRGAIVLASDALEDYLAESRRDRVEEVFYKTALLLVSRMIEVLINLVLTGWFRLDGFSSSLAARRAIRSYVVDNKGNGFAANAFITGALVKYNAKNTSVCQVLSFRSGIFLTVKTLSFIVGGANLICGITWSVLVAFDGEGKKRYEIPTVQPSIPRVAVIIAAICFSLGMDCLEIFSEKISGRRRLIIWIGLILEIPCILSCSIVAGALGIKAIGRWLYSCLQGLVWVKWGIGCYLLGEYSPEYVHRPARRTRLDTSLEILAYSSAKWIDHGILVYSSAFFLNAVLTGLGLKWK